MLYLANDLHSKQITVNLRGEDGEVMLRRQVSTRGDEPRKFLEEVARRAGPEGYVAILEVCGFHDWFTQLLPQCGCQEVVLIQAKQQSRRKTDRRDANQLGEILWLNRQRLLAGRPVQGVRRIVPTTPTQQHDRRLTQLRRNVGRELIRTINGVQHILRRLNLGQHCPTKGIQTNKARKWLAALPLPQLDRFEMNYLLSRWKHLEEHRQTLDAQIVERELSDPQAQLLMSVPGVASFMALAFVSRIGDINRFRTPRSLPNYWGLTPGCRNSGESNQRLGSITKEGSTLARFLLGQLVMHVLRKDAAMREWYQRIKRRRGAKIARVAVMRRLAVIFWHMLKHQQPYDLAAAVSRPRPTPRRKAKPVETKPAEPANVSAAPNAAAAPQAAALGALPPNPRELAPEAPFEQPPAASKAAPAPSKAAPAPTATRKAKGRPKPPPLRTEPGSGAQVVSRQSPILPPG